MPILKPLLPVLLCCLLAYPQAKPAAKTAAATSTPGFDIHALDKTVDPCANFYQFACGTWIKNNPVPSDRSRWDRFDELAERNSTILKGILEAAAKGGAGRDAVNQKIGDFYGACMDESVINKKGIEPLRPWLDALNAMKSKSGLTDAVIALHKDNGPGFFNFGSDADFKDSSMEIAEFGQGGLGLPTKEYYTKTDPKSVETRQQYEDHVARMLILLGDRPVNAVAEAKTILAIETDLASASLDPVQLRDPAQIYHKMTVDDWQKLTPSFDYRKYLAGIGAPKVDSLNVGMPEFAKGFEGVIGKYPVEDLRAYLRWHAVHWAARLLPAAFADENFAFYGRTLNGQKEQRPRWKRCVQMTDANLGEALGIAYVKKAFGPNARLRMAELVKNVENALRQDIEGLDWMSPATKKEALVKLAAIANKVGYPEKWRDYSSLKIASGDALGNYLRAQQFEEKRQLDKIGHPVDRKEWGMTPPTVNAYYNPQENNINFPAGILQPPFFDSQMDDGVNYGAIGAVIGHEITHGFDDQGSQFDPAGNLKDWWTEDDKKAFEARTSCIAKQYDGYVAVDDVHINGKLTLGENTADNGGVRIALMALEAALKGKPVPRKDGFTAEQRLFLGWSQVWCGNQTPESKRVQALSNEHSLGEFRVNGVVSNMPEFRKAFSCQGGSPMAPTNMCRVW
jgi:putative endopeptidase